MFWLLTNNASDSSSRNKVEGEGTWSPILSQTFEGWSMVNGEADLLLTCYSPCFIDVQMENREAE